MGNNRFSSPCKAGFSLVELSIVLVILGLLTGGILAGQSLIRAAELRAVSTEYQRYIAAVQSFRGKYLMLPGDMNNATRFWGQVSSCPDTASTGTLTCDGNGDGIVINNSEPTWAWQQLAAAGLIEGTYLGRPGAGTSSDPVHGPLNNPSSRLRPALWVTGYWSLLSGDGTRFDGAYGHVLQFGIGTNTSSNSTAVLKPEELWNIDSKMDDGVPNTGNVVARRYATCTNAANSASTNVSYALSTASVECVGVFRNSF